MSALDLSKQRGSQLPSWFYRVISPLSSLSCQIHATQYLSIPSPSCPPLPVCLGHAPWGRPLFYLTPLWRGRMFFTLTRSGFCFSKTQGTAKCFQRIHGCRERAARFAPHTLWNHFLSVTPARPPSGVGMKTEQSCCGPLAR